MVHFYVTVYCPLSLALQWALIDLKAMIDVHLWIMIRWGHWHLLHLEGEISWERLWGYPKLQRWQLLPQERFRCSDILVANPIFLCRFRKLFVIILTTLLGHSFILCDVEGFITEQNGGKLYKKIGSINIKMRRNRSACFGI